MNPSIDLKSSFIDSLEMRGVPGAEHEVYARVLYELAGFLQRPPQTWTRRDMERFLRLRAPLLGQHEMATYGTALGILTELVERLVAADMEIRLEVHDADVSLETTENDAIDLERAERTDFLAETLERLVSKPRTGAFGRSVNRPDTPSWSRPLSAPGSRRPTSGTRETVPATTSARQTPLRPAGSRPARPLGGVRRDDFLGEHIDRWREKTGPHATPAGSAVHSTQPTVERATRYDDTPTPDFASQDPRAACDEEVRLQAGIRTHWSPGGWAELRWAGFVSGERLRHTLEQLVETLESRKASSVLADMREASVLSQDDTDWFANWLQRSTSRGLRRFAIVTPTHVISRMQLSRLRHLNDVSSIGSPLTHRLEIDFFDAVSEARNWLLAG